MTASHTDPSLHSASLQEAERPPARGAKASRERGPRGERETVPERSRGEVDSGYTGFRVRPEPRPVLAVGRELVERQQVAKMESGVDREARVALREHEPVTVRVARVDGLEDVCVERGDDVRDGERRADVADARPHRLLEDDAAYPLRERADVRRARAWCRRSHASGGRPWSPAPPELENDESEPAALCDAELESLGQGLIGSRQEIVAEPRVADGIELGECLGRLAHEHGLRDDE